MLQDRVMQLWVQNQKSPIKIELDTEKLLQVFECLAEDELYRDHDIEIETLERVLREGAEPLKPSRSTMTAKQQVRYSIFTIDEEEDERNETVPNLFMSESKPFDIDERIVGSHEDDSKLLDTENEDLLKLPEELDRIVD